MTKSVPRLHDEFLPEVDVDDGWTEQPASDVRVRVLHDDDSDDAQPTVLNPLAGELARLADVDSVPRKLGGSASAVLPPEASLLWSLIDGRASLRAILSACAMPEAEALRVLALLLEHRCLTFYPGKRG